MNPIDARLLQQLVPTLEPIPLDQLEWLIANAKHYTLAIGDFLFKKDDEIRGMHILLKGKIEVFFYQNNSQKLFTKFEKGSITGILPYSRAKLATGSAQASEECEVLTLPKEKLPEMIQKNFELTQVLVHTMTTRIREFTQREVQNEKLMALGKISAGLAHELNNPAAAIVRSSTALKKHLQVLPEGFKRVISIRLSDEQVDKVNGILFAKISSKPEDSLPLKIKTKKEDEFVNWLEEHQVDEDAYEIAENLVEFGFELQEMEEIWAICTEAYFPPVMQWINNNLTTEKMVEEISVASRRIAELINSVKSYSYMDRSQDLQEVDLHQGLKDTLTILHHNLKKNHILLVEEFAEGPLLVKGLPGELNQIWTNLIDNAIDAMEGKEGSMLKITTKKDGNYAKVHIIDNGEGIPEEVKNKIFEPFFTTKDMGKGTGLGLDIVKKIVDQHDALIEVKSQPGHTEFMVCFPQSN